MPYFNFETLTSGNKEAEATVIAAEESGYSLIPVFYTQTGHSEKHLGTFEVLRLIQNINNEMKFEISKGKCKLYPTLTGQRRGWLIDTEFNRDMLAKWIPSGLIEVRDVTIKKQIKEYAIENNLQSEPTPIVKGRMRKSVREQRYEKTIIDKSDELLRKEKELKEKDDLLQATLLQMQNLTTIVENMQTEQALAKKSIEDTKTDIDKAAESLENSVAYRESNDTVIPAKLTLDEESNEVVEQEEVKVEVKPKTPSKKPAAKAPAKKAPAKKPATRSNNKK